MMYNMPSSSIVDGANIIQKGYICQKKKHVNIAAISTLYGLLKTCTAQMSVGLC